MKIVLIDDNGPALGLLAYQLSLCASDLDLKKIVAVWTEGKVIPHDLQVAITQSALNVVTEIVGVDTEQELVSRITEELETLDLIAYVSDLNMNKIGLHSVRNGSWYDEHSGLRMFLSQASKSGHAIFLHSGALKTRPLIGTLTANGVRAEALTACFEDEIDPSDAAENVAAEIVSRLRGTSLEKLWGDSYSCVSASVEPTATSWFSTQSEPSDTNPVPHNWKQDFAQSKSYKNAICAGLGIPDLPEEIWTEAFHESLKGIAGKYFVGSDGYDREKTTSLRLGSVFIIVLIAYHNVYGNIDQVRDLFKCDKKLAMKPFTCVLDGYGPLDKRTAREMSIALLFAFEACLKRESKHDDGHLTAIKHLEDGLALHFDWEPINLFNRAREAITTSPKPLDGSRLKRPAKSAEAIAVIVSVLAYHPGRVLPGRYTINIQVVSQI